jgi:Tol biopolymer transport system component
MTTNDRFARELAAWLQADARQPVPDRYDAVLAATSGAPQRPWWSSLERWLPMDTTFPRRLAPVPRYAWLFVILALLVALSAVILAVGSLPRNAEPFGLARNGSVVYAGTDGDIYARDSLTGVTTALVRGPEIDLAPTFSNDGSRFVFARTSADPRQHMIMVANADGTGVRRLTDPLPNLTAWAWSPDGSRLAVSSWDDEWLWILAMDGTKQVLISAGVSPEFLQWRPDGTELVFRGETRGSPPTHGLYTIRADGTDTGPEAILPPTDNNEHWQNPALSPDGTKVIYTQWAPGHLWVVDLDTRKAKMLRFQPYVESDYYAQWSPDGSQIVFNRGQAQKEYHLAVAPAEGGQVTNIGPQMAWDDAAVAGFSPDGSKVIARYSDGTTRILGVADGSDELLPATLDYIGSWQRRAP